MRKLLPIPESCHECSRRRDYRADERCQVHGAEAAATVHNRVKSAEPAPGFDRPHFASTSWEGMGHAARGSAFSVCCWQLALALGLSVLGAIDGARAEQQPSRIVVTGEGEVGVAPDIAQIRSGVTTRGKTVLEATEANSKLMAAILTALTESGIPQKDVQTAQLSIQPVYASPEPGKEQRLVGYSVGNHINAKIKHIDRLGDVLDRMIAAGAIEVWSLEFLLSDPSKALDRAREAAIADARRKAAVYARAAGVTLGRVVSIEEESGSFAPVPKRALAQPAGAQIPIAPGENTLHATVTVGFEIAGQ